jgi:thiosulfate/3-mercaptopyruvate sulfurtransferase
MVKVVSVEEVKALKNKGEKLVFLEASWVMGPKPNLQEFKEKYYGNFEEITKLKKHPEFESSRLPGAQPFSLEIFCPPGEQTRFDFYPVEVFQKLLRFLGVNEGDSIVVYARGPMAGMAFAARAAFVLQLYGLSPLILNGGLSAWTAAGEATESGEWTHPAQEGNVTVKAFNSNHSLITFDELNKKDAEGESTFDHLDQINYLDCRPKEQFDEGKGTTFGPHSTGFHCRGARHFSNGTICNEQGLFGLEALKKVASTLKDNAPTVTACNTGLGASLAWLALDQAGVKARLFNGSMTEISARASHLINEK